ncbi:centromere protein R isoform X2 [Antennarius striatus]|uniref:centromere protein R isoform X2 n=1 Tax=Antennarius striatus TaxID=241820 RepID=UPI0035B19D47
MSVRKAAGSHSTHQHPASKIPVPLRQRTPHGGTESPSGKTKVTRRAQEFPRTELEKLDCLRSKMEKSVEAFINAREELAKIISADGSSEQEHFFHGSSAELRAELKRHGELTSRVESSLKEHEDPKHSVQGTVKIRSSYEFLKSIVG